MSELLHPGYIRESASLDERLDARMRVKFEDFYPFIHQAGIDEVLSKPFEGFLRQFFEDFRDIWTPGSCFLWGFAFPEACETLKKVQFPEPYGFKLKHYGKSMVSSNAHFWGSLQAGGTELVVDPTGVHLSNPFTGDYSKLRPHFGLLEKASGLPQRYYRWSSEVEVGSLISVIVGGTRSSGTTA